MQAWEEAYGPRPGKGEKRKGAATRMKAPAPAVSSGTSASEILLRAFGIEGKEVLRPDDHLLRHPRRRPPWGRPSHWLGEMQGLCVLREMNAKEGKRGMGVAAVAA